MERLRQRFLVQRWPEGAVVYDTATGDTHAMDTFVMGVFEGSLSQPNIDLRELALRSGQGDVDASRIDDCLSMLGRMDLTAAHGRG